MFLPLFFKSGLTCLVIGGGQVASHKIRILREADCNITIIAPEISESIAEEVKRLSVRWLEREWTDGDCDGYQLVIAATPVRGVNRRISEEARKHGIPINVVDDPELSTVIFPAIWREQSLSVAVSTGGAAPFMSSEIRTLLARCASGMGQWVETGKRFREAVKKEVAKTEDKNALYRRFLDVVPTDLTDVPRGEMSLDAWLAWMDEIAETHKH